MEFKPRGFSFRFLSILGARVYALVLPTEFNQRGVY